MAISIHALREESDVQEKLKASLDGAISIHALREESDHKTDRWSVYGAKFQSTLSARRATLN